MSFNRENVVWENSDGEWRIGFFDILYQTGDDPEWAVEYDFSAFQWVSRAYPTSEAAKAAWKGSNPGGHVVVEYAGNHDLCERYDEMAAECQEESWCTLA